MAMPSSGSISFSQLQTEFGGSNPISLSEYYRNGSYVGSHNTGVPTSGVISMSNFYGAFAADVVPDTLNWANISASGGMGGGATGSNANVTITGLGSGVSITLNVDISSVDNPGEAELYLYGRKNGGSWQLLWDNTGIGIYGTLSVANNDLVQFQASGTSSFGGTYNPSFLVSVRNQSSANTVLDTFTVALDWTSP